MRNDEHGPEIQDYLDGRLTGEALAAFERRMEHDASLARQVEDYRRLGDALRADASDLPPGFYARARARFEARQPSERRWFRLLSWESAGVATAALLVGALFLPPLLEEAPFLRSPAGDLVGAADPAGSAGRSGAANRRETSSEEFDEPSGPGYVTTPTTETARPEESKKAATGRATAPGSRLDAPAPPPHEIEQPRSSFEESAAKQAPALQDRLGAPPAAGDLPARPSQPAPASAGSGSESKAKLRRVPEEEQRRRGQAAVTPTAEARAAEAMDLSDVRADEDNKRSAEKQAFAPSGRASSAFLPAGWLEPGEMRIVTNTEDWNRLRDSSRISGKPDRAMGEDARLEVAAEHAEHLTRSSLQPAEAASPPTPDFDAWRAVLIGPRRFPVDCERIRAIVTGDEVTLVLPSAPAAAVQGEAAGCLVLIEVGDLPVRLVDPR